MSRNSRGNRARRVPAAVRRPELSVQRLEERCTPSVFRSIDGTGTNLAHPDWGSTDEALLRKAVAAYADRIDDLVVGNPARPSPREISNVIVDQGDADIISNRLLSAMIYAWGQFIDHDMDLTTGANPAQAANIPVPTGDPFFDPAGTGTKVINFNRSESVASTGTSTSNPRQQPNDITAFLDASMVYGSNAVVANALRTHQGGRLKTSPGPDGVIGTADDWLPFNNQTYFPGIHQNGDPSNPAAFKIANDSHIVPDDQLFMAGDVRVNENIELTSLHTLFVREHNRWADRIHAANPRLSDEDVYQMARAIVGAEIQSITYNEWIPALLGPNALPAYRGYNANVNPGIATEFSTALFRVGHTMLGEDVEFIGNNGVPIRDEIPLSQAFFNPPELQQQGISPILKYLVSDPSSEIDSTIVGSVRNFLFGPPGAGGFDLASLNIQRGRDHGLADYNTVRAAYGLPRVTSFSQISSDPEIQAKLQQLYGNVNNIDLWVGALAEDHVPGTSTGPLVRAALIDQFRRLRDGDRFWYERYFDPSFVNVLENTKLSDIIRRNSAADVVQDNVFFFRASISGTVFNDLNRNGRQDRGEAGLSGRTIQLVNANDPADPALVATTTTDRNGNYSFDVFDGLRTGNYRIIEVLPNGWRATTTNPRNANIPRGETFRDVDFGNARSFTSPLAGVGSGLGLTGGVTSTGTAVATTTDSTRPAKTQPATLPGSSVALARSNASTDATSPIWVDAGKPASTPVLGDWFATLVTSNKLLAVKL